MNRSTVNFSTLFCALLFGQSAFAGGWGGLQEIDLIYPHTAANGSYIIQANMANPDACSLSDFYVLDKNNTNFEEIFAVVLAARVAGLQVDLYLSGCLNSRPVISLAKL